jgi:hypothetical protein
MIFGGTSLSNLADAFGRSLNGGRSAQKIKDTEFDIYERAPVLRADIEAMLSIEIAQNDDLIEQDAVEQEEVLRESEKREHDTMCMIRGALYPVD